MTNIVFPSDFDQPLLQNAKISTDYGLQYQTYDSGVTSAYRIRGSDAKDITSFSLVYQLNKAQYQEFVEFFRDTTDYGRLQFTISLFIIGESRDLIVKFISTPNISIVYDQIFRVGFSIQSNDFIDELI